VAKGDNRQLQPFGGYPLFRVSTAGLEPIAMKGQITYRALNKYSGDEKAPEMNQFRDTLEVLHNDDLSLANWDSLGSRAKINISPDEIASFDQALHQRRDRSLRPQQARG
jgi:hypothetical protein